MKYFKFIASMLCVVIPFNFSYSQQKGSVKDTLKPALVIGEFRSMYQTNIKPIDSLSIYFKENLLDPVEDMNLSKSLSVKLEDGNLLEGTIDMKTFRFEIPPFGRTSYLSIGSGGIQYLDMYFIEPGDTVLIYLDPTSGHMAFAGNAKEKFRVQYEIKLAKRSESLYKDPIMRTMVPSQTREKFLSDSTILTFYLSAIKKRKNFGMGKVLQYINPGEEEYKYFKSVYHKELSDDLRWKVLERNKHDLPESFYFLLKASLEGELLDSKVKACLGLLNYVDDEEEKRRYAEGVLQMPAQPNLEAVYVLSEPYIKYLMRRAITLAKLTSKELNDVIVAQYQGEIRDKVLGLYYLESYKRIPNEAGLINALQIVKTPWVLTILQNLYDTHKVGRLVEFTLPNVKGHLIKLSDFRGKIVLLDFWYTGCGACIIMYQKSLKQVVAHYRNNKNFVKISISSDTDKAKWLNSIQQHTYTSPESINLNTEGYKHPFLLKQNIHAYPYLMLIDKQGKIYKAGGLQLPAEELIEIIDKALQR